MIMHFLVVLVGIWTPQILLRLNFLSFTSAVVNSNNIHIIIQWKYTYT